MNEKLFVGLEVHAKTIAVAVTEPGRGGETHSLGMPRTVGSAFLTGFLLRRRIRASPPEFQVSGLKSQDLEPATVDSVCGGAERRSSRIVP
jgi:hypothetical protein